MPVSQAMFPTNEEPQPSHSYGEANSHLSPQPVRRKAWKKNPPPPCRQDVGALENHTLDLSSLLSEGDTWASYPKTHKTTEINGDEFCSGL